MEIKLSLNQNSLLDLKEQKERVDQTRKTVTEANKTIAEQIEDLVSSLKKPIEGKDKIFFDLAREALISGEKQRVKDGKLSKSEMIELGKQIKAEREEVERNKRIEEVLKNKPDNFHILTDDSQLSGFIERLREECRLQREQWAGRWERLGVKSLTAHDFEGTGLDWFLDFTIGYSVWLPILNEGYYIPYGHITGEKQLSRSKVIKALKPYMEAETEGKSFHMSSPRYDLHVTKKDGYEIRGCVWDSADAMYLLNEHEESYALKRLTQKYGQYFGIEGDVYTFDDLFGNGSPAPYSVELVGIYAIKDVLYGWKLTEFQFEMMKKTDNLLDCYALIDSKLPETDCMLQRTGFDVDLEALKELEIDFTARLKKAEAALFEAYEIDDKFLNKMNKTINKHKIEKWVVDQRERIRKWEEKVKKKQQQIKEYEEKGKEHTKAYQQARKQLDKYLDYDRPLEAEPELAPFEIKEFSLTNNNHIAYLIYDHLGVKDITSRFKKGKTRATSKDILEEYFKTEESLKPLKEVSALEKLLNTYVKKIPEALDVTGRIHSMFDSTGTSTGRYSSSQYTARPSEVYEEIKNMIGGDWIEHI